MKRCPSCKTVFPTDYTLCPRDGSSLITIGEWAEGTLVRGKYRILAKIGQGGMGSVYKAMHTRFREVRAIKVISPELASDTSFVRRFEQEAIITRKLQHPNAVRVEDIDEAEDGRPFIVMEYIEGHSLKDVIEHEAPMDVHRVCAIVKQAAAALDAAHSLGLIHRDIKPANIALLRSTDESGARAEQVKVLDFGIAKLKEAQAEDSKASHLSHLTLTSTGVVIGTPAYMSPEQARGMKGDQLDGRSDIYSLGIVMYQMLTANLPLKADSTIEQLMAHINIPPRPIREVRPDVPEGVAAAVMRCLDKKRELRPANGQALMDEIEFAAAGGPRLALLSSAAMTKEQVEARRAAELAAEPTVARQGGTRRSRLWVGVVAAVLIAGALGGGLYWRGRKPPAVQDGPRVTSDDTKAEPAVAPIAKPSAPAPAEQLVPAMPVTPPSARSQGGAHSRQGSETPKPLGPPSRAVAAKSPPAPVDDPALGSKPPVTVPETSSPPPSVPAPAVGSSSPVPTSPAADLYIHTDPVVDREVYVWVYLDGGHKETIRHSDGRLQILGLPLGQHRLELQVPKYEPYEETVDLAAGLNVDSVTLVPAGSGGPSAPSQPLSRATAEQANADEAVPTFEVAYFHGLHKTNGQLTVSKEGLVFNGYGTNAADKFNLPCSEVVEAKMPSSFVRNNPFGQDETSFHVKGRSKKYYFDTWDKNGVVRDTILRAIRSACNLR